VSLRRNRVHRRYPTTGDERRPTPSDRCHRRSGNRQTRDLQKSFDASGRSCSCMSKKVIVLALLAIVAIAFVARR
jgi:hypothetical protein